MLIMQLFCVDATISKKDMLSLKYLPLPDEDILQFLS